ncbi:MAG: hypothetical protein WAV54_02240 [Acidimicrobiales bacterium]
MKRSSANHVRVVVDHTGRGIGHERQLHLAEVRAQLRPRDAYANLPTECFMGP